MQGAGLDYLTAVLSAASPGFVVMLQSKNPRKNLPSHAFWLQHAEAVASNVRLLAVPGIGSQGLATQIEGNTILCITTIG